MSVVKLLRLLNGYTQSKLSELLGCTISTYNKKENGKAQFTVEEYKLLAQCYDVPIYKLLQNNVVDECLKVIQG